MAKGLCIVSEEFIESCKADNSHIEELHTDGTNIYRKEFLIGRILDVSVYVFHDEAFFRSQMTIYIKINNRDITPVSLSNTENSELYQFLKDY